MMTADEIAGELTEYIINDLPYESGDEVAVLVNGLGATPLEELYVVFRALAKLLEARSIKIYRSYVGEFATSMEMAGLSVSLMRLDDQLKYYLDKPCNSPFFVQA
jgi:dihydroxyacetone kinase